MYIKRELHLSDLASYSSKSCHWWEKWLTDSNNEWFVFCPRYQIFEKFQCIQNISFQHYSTLGDIGQSKIFNVISKLVLRIEALEVDNQNMANKMKNIDEKLDQIVSSDKSEEESSVTAITPSAAIESGKWIL